MDDNSEFDEPSDDIIGPGAERDFLIAGIGASAGGIQALKEFFECVPADSAAACVVILHLSPDRESQLAQVLQAVSKIPVRQVSEQTHIEPNHVYVVPPNRHLTMIDGSIAVSPTNVEAKNLKVRIGERAETINIHVRPVLRPTDTARGFFLVLFEKTDETSDKTEEVFTLPEPVARQLEEELMRSKAHLRATIEQYEIQAEELKASNEELKAVNEELRSSAEELETSREKLQSVNEELLTVNQELKIKIEEISQSNNNLQNLMNSTDIGTIFLDRSFRVNLYTPAAGRIFNEHKLANEHLRLSEEQLRFAAEAAEMGVWDLDLTTGEARTSLHHNRIFGYAEPVEAWGPEIFRRHILPDEQERFEQAFAQAMETGVFDFQARVRWGDNSVHWIYDRGRVYYDERNRPVRMVGVVLDITGRKRADEALRESEERLKSILEGIADYAIITLDVKGCITGWNTGAENIFGFTESEIIGQDAGIIFTPEDRKEGADRKEIKKALAEGRSEDERWHIRKDGSRFYASGILTLLHGGGMHGFVKIARDLTERQRAEEHLRLAHEELETRVQQRTAELATANEALQVEMIERKQAEDERIEILQQLVTAQENERRRIARDLHDQLGQQLTALRLKLEILRKMCDDKKLCEQIEQTQAVAERIDADVDFLAWEMRPTVLDDIGIVAALADYVREWSSHFGIPAEFSAARFGKKRLAPEVETNLYRIAQEALNNVYKHAQAKKAEIFLEPRDGFAVLIIADDGVGFEPGKKILNGGGAKGMGLIGMKERAALVGGSLEIESARGEGTTVYARVPVSNGKKGKKKDE